MPTNENALLAPPTMTSISILGKRQIGENIGKTIGHLAALQNVMEFGGRSGFLYEKMPTMLLFSPLIQLISVLGERTTVYRTC